MSASCSAESETKVESSPPNTILKVDSRYALYLFSNNKHASSSGSEHSGSERGSVSSSKTEFEEPSVCLSLLEGNLNAEQETVVRCYLLNALSLRECLSFENEGKYAVLHFSDESEEPFGCYYHRLSKVSVAPNAEQSDEDISKRHTFFICLIGPANGVMESFCPELSAFCCSLIALLDPEGLKNKEDVQLKLKSWYVYCVEYVGRCIDKFREDIPLILHCSLWGNVELNIKNEDTKWDLERFIETCSLMPNNIEMKESSQLSEEIHSLLKLREENGRLLIEGKSLAPSPYCLKWFERLKNCSSSDDKSLHSILEGFRLKTIQDLNSLKRLLQKAVNDHYSLYKAFLFLRDSGFEDVLLYHVKREACVANETEVLDVITCLQEFIQEQHS